MNTLRFSRALFLLYNYKGGRQGTDKSRFARIPIALYYARSFETVKTNFLILTVVKHFPAKQRELNKQFYLFYK